MELVFQADGQTVQRAYGCLVGLEVLVKLLRVSNGGIEEDLVKTIDLRYISA